MSARTRTFTATTTAASVPAARHRTRAALTSCGMDPEHPVVDTALLILSELVTNSVVHGSEHSSHFAVTLTVDAHALIIAVHDRHPHLPESPSPSAGHEDINGRGLGLVAHLSAEAGGLIETAADADKGGKTICVRLPLPREARRDTPDLTQGPQARPAPDLGLAAFSGSRTSNGWMPYTAWGPSPPDDGDQGARD